MKKKKSIGSLRVAQGSERRGGRDRVSGILGVALMALRVMSYPASCYNYKMSTTSSAEPIGRYHSGTLVPISTTALKQQRFRKVLEMLAMTEASDMYNKAFLGEFMLRSFHMYPP